VGRAVEGSAVRHSGRPTFAVLQPLFLLSSQEPVTFFDLSVFFAAPPRSYFNPLAKPSS
jgi:hypothetical protein